MIYGIVLQRNDCCEIGNSPELKLGQCLENERRNYRAKRVNGRFISSGSIVNVDFK